MTYSRLDAIFRVVEFAPNTKLTFLGLQEELKHF